MRAIITVILPVFAIMLTGYLAGRFRVLGAASSDALNRFVYYFALPALFIVSLAQVPIRDVFHVPFLAAFGGGLLLTFGFALVVGRIFFPNRLAALGLHAMCAIFSNTGYLGIPLLLIAFGEAGKLPAIISTVIMGTVVMAIGVVLIETDLSRGRGRLAIAANVAAGVAKSPLILAAGAGLVISAAGLRLPAPLATFGDTLGAAASPCALFAIGLFLAGQSVTTGRVEIGWLVAVKLMVQPAVTWWLAYRVLSMDPTWAATAVIQSALPTGTLVFVLAQQYGIFVHRATAAIMVSTLASMITLSLLFAILGVG
jgi:predicted permease